MEDYNNRITESLAYMLKSIQDLKFDNDLCHLKSTLRHIRDQVDLAFDVVNSELDATRRTRRKKNQDAAL